VPLQIASQVVDAAREVRQRRQQLIGLRRAAGFTLERLRQAIQDTVLPPKVSKSKLEGREKL
jgi:hypothetical protein